MFLYRSNVEWIQVFVSKQEWVFLWHYIHLKQCWLLLLNQIGLSSFIPVFLLEYNIWETHRWSICGKPSCRAQYISSLNIQAKKRKHKNLFELQLCQLAWTYEIGRSTALLWEMKQMDLTVICYLHPAGKCTDFIQEISKKNRKHGNMFVIWLGVKSVQTWQSGNHWFKTFTSNSCDSHLRFPFP